MFTGNRRPKAQGIIFLLFFSVSLSFAIPAAYGGKYPPAVGLALSKAAPLIKKQKYNQAAAILKKALSQKDGKHKEVYLLLGNCSMLSKNHKAAVSAYRNAARLEPGDPVVWLNLAKTQYELKQFQGAAKSFRTAWDKESPQKRTAEILYYSGGSWLMAGNNKNAISTFGKLFATYPGKIKKEWREQYIHALINDKQTRKALPLIRKMVATTTGKKKMQWQEILLSEYVELKMYKEAEKYARALAKSTPGEMKWWKALTHVLLGANKLEAAIATLTVQSYLTPLNNREQTLLADLCLQTNIPSRAAPLYQKILSKKFSRKTLQRLIISLYRQDKNIEALKVLKQYRREADKSATILQLEGEIHFTRQEFKKAVQAYSKAAGIKGHQQGQAWLMAGYASMQAEDFRASRQYLRNAMQFKKQQKSASSALKHLRAIQQRHEKLSEPAQNAAES